LTHSDGPLSREEEGGKVSERELAVQVVLTVIWKVVRRIVHLHGGALPPLSFAYPAGKKDGFRLANSLQNQNSPAC
jgi:hypothetical protein